MAMMDLFTESSLRLVAQRGILLIRMGLKYVASQSSLSQTSRVNMPYQRPHSVRIPNREVRAALLQSYFDHYRTVAKEDPMALNRKIPRAVFDNVLDQIGSLLIEKSSLLANEPGPVRDFLRENLLPKSLEGLLPEDFRVFCLALNALKQWLTAEQAATDRYLLGGKAREECRQVATTCIVTGEPLDPSTAELHHPVRDGRPPIPLSKAGHKQLEGQVGLHGSSSRRLRQPVEQPECLEGQLASPPQDSTRAKILAIRKRMNRSWGDLRRGCLDILGRETSHSTSSVGASSRTFVRKVSRETGLTAEQILEWLDMNSLGG